MKTIPAKLLAVCAVAALPLAATAGDGPYVGVEGGANWQRHQFSLDDAKFKTGGVAGLTAGYAFANGLRPELEFAYRRNRVESLLGTEADGLGHGKAYTGMANLWYDIKDGNGLIPTGGMFSKFHPYFGGGIGDARVTAKSYTNPTTGAVDFNDHRYLFAFQVGAGVGYDITQNLTASLDYRALRTLIGDFNGVGSRYNTQSAMIGLRYSFGAQPMAVAAAPVAAAAAPVAKPAPAPKPKPAPVVDTDGDGVPDNLDKCPNTPHGFKVDASGCIVKQNVILRGVNFEYNSDAMTGPARTTLDEVAAALKGQPGLEVQVNGYTDSRGSSAYNHKLSQKRANAVRNYLVSKGVEGRNLVAKGFGEEHPVASNATEAGRAENRRVEFVVINTPATVKVINESPSATSVKAAESADKPAKKAVKKHKKHKKAAAKPAAAAPAAEPAAKQ